MYMKQHFQITFCAVHKNTLNSEIKWNANLMQQGNFIDVFLARRFGYICPSSGALDVQLQHMVFCTEFLDGWWSWEPLRTSCLWCRAWHHLHRLSRPPPNQKLSAENHMLQLNISCSWWWVYVPETCQAKNTSIKLPCCIVTLFHEEDAWSNNPQY